MNVSRSCSVLLAAFVFAAGATGAAAHCCHDDRQLGAAAQNEMRSGLHGLGDGLTDESIHAESPDIDEGIDTRDDAGVGAGRYGQMQGNSLGNYGAGSLGERGPGGLGAMRSGGMGAPARPR